MEPNKTFRLNHDSARIQGYIEGIEAVKQAVFLMLSVPRMEHLIHSANYGHEFLDLIGKDDEYVHGDIHRIIREALMIDERIIDVENIVLKKIGENLEATFRVKTIYGSFEEGREVAIGGI